MDQPRRAANLGLPKVVDADQCRLADLVSPSRACVVRCARSLIDPTTRKQVLLVTSDSDDGAVERAELNRRSDELASRLAYEWGWRLSEGAVRALEAQRTRAVALLSVAILAAGIAASATSARDITDGRQSFGLVGLILFVSGVVAVVVCAMAVAWPIKSSALLDPDKIIQHYVEPRHELRTPAWVHERLSADLSVEYRRLERTFKIRNVFYMCAIAAIPAVVIGAGLIWLDG